MNPQDPLTPEQERALGVTLAECEGVAIEAETLREENGILRRATKLLEQSNAVLLEAVRATTAQADAQGRRAEAEGKRADIELGLRVATQDRLEKEVRKGRWNLVKGIVYGVVGGAIATLIAVGASGGN